MRGCMAALLFALLCACAASSLADWAWVETGKGPLNMRRKPDGGAAIVRRIPDGEWIEVLSADGAWSHVSFGGKAGYVKTAFLRLASQMTGKTVYPDETYLYLRAEAAGDAKSIASIHASQPMIILEPGGEWIRVSVEDPLYGALEGWVRREEISQWRDEPPAQAGEAFHVYAALSAEQLALGDVLDVCVTTAEDAVCVLSLSRDGEMLCEGLEIGYSPVSYRPRACGTYRLEIMASRPDGHAIGCEAYFTVGEQRQAEAGFALYSQKDGWWQDKKYGRSNLETSGCAIFTLAHALQLLGASSQGASPQELALKYPMYLAESGTVTSSLLAAAGRDFGFSSGKDKIRDRAEIARRFGEGAVFSFSPAEGHIALAAGLSGDGQWVRVLDSAPSATFERIRNAALYYRDAQGEYLAAASLADLPGIRYYFDTGEFGGAEYYLHIDYVAGRGVRLIAPKKP